MVRAFNGRTAQGVSETDHSAGWVAVVTGRGKIDTHYQGGATAYEDGYSYQLRFIGPSSWAEMKEPPKVEFEWFGYGRESGMFGSRYTKLLPEEERAYWERELVRMTLAGKW